MTIKLGLLNDVQVRFLCPADLEEVKRLCREWFPIEYPDVWYDEITSSSRFFSLAATLNKNIIGLLVAEVKTKSLCNKEDAGILSFTFSDDTLVAYILSIGVVKVYRRHGIGSLLLDSLLSHLTTPERQNCKAVYLHVLTTNSAAMQFYEKRHFLQFRYLPLYYAINGAHKDGFSYALYINGGEPPWTLAYPFNFPFAFVGQGYSLVYVPAAGKFHLHGKALSVADVWHIQITVLTFMPAGFIRSQAFLSFIIYLIFVTNK